MTTGKTRKDLDAVGFRQPVKSRYGPAFVVVLVVILTALTWRYSVLVTGQPDIGSELASTVATIGIFIVAYQQWRAAREEASLDKFYDRLDISNRRLEELEGSDRYDIYVFSELDNLEYIVERYRMGYITDRQALRCLRTFQSRCEDEKFRARATHWVQEAGYHDQTRKVVDQVAKNAIALDA